VPFFSISPFRAAAAVSFAFCAFAPLVARADEALLRAPATFTPYPQPDTSIHAWIDRSDPKAKPPQSLSTTAHPYAGSLAGFVKERLFVSHDRTPSLVVVAQRDVTLCGRPGSYLETTYTAGGTSYHADSVMGVGTTNGYVANYVRAMKQPAKSAALAALFGFCVKASH